MSGEAIDLTVAPAELVTVASYPPETIELTLVDEDVVVSVVEAEPVELLVSEPETIEITVAGLIGPQGPPGPSGGSTPAGTYRFPQTVPSTVWSINHALGYRPAVSVEDTAGTRIEGDVAYLDADHLTITFSAPFAGYANLS